MKALALALLVGGTVFLSGCLSTAGLTGEQKANLTPEAKLYALQSDYVTALKVFSPYLSQPWCVDAITVGCKDKEVVLHLQKLDKEICGPPPVQGQRGCSPDSAFGIASAAKGDAQLGAIQAVRALLIRFSSQIAKLRVAT